MPSGQNRRKARKQALGVLYALSFNPVADVYELERFFKQCLLVNGPPTETVPANEPPSGFAWQLVHGVYLCQRQMDEIISENSRNWKISRIAPLDLSILRLALLEMFIRKENPAQVIINEAVLLAKEFSDDNAPAFINGILDGAAKKLASQDREERS